MKQKKLSIFSKYLLIVLGFFLNVNPFFGEIRPILSVGYFLLLLFVFVSLQRKAKFQTVYIVMFVIWVLIGIQGVIWGITIPAAVWYPISTFMTAFLLFTIIGGGYFQLLFNVIYFTSIFTSVIWVLEFIPVVESIITNLVTIAYSFNWDVIPRSILFYTQRGVVDSQFGWVRNSGLFHEPGAFGVYLSLAIVINTIISGKVINNKNILLGLIVLSTFSTASLLGVMVFILLVIQKSKINILSKIVGFSFGITVVALLFVNFTFMQEKISNTFERENLALENGEKTRGRFYAFGKTMETVYESPIVGRGILLASSAQERLNENELVSYGYGFIGIIAKYGLFFGCFYLLYIYIGIRKLTYFYKNKNNFTFAFFILINIPLLSQGFIQHYPFVILFYLGLKKYKFEHSKIKYLLKT